MAALQVIGVLGAREHLALVVELLTDPTLPLGSGFSEAELFEAGRGGGLPGEVEGVALGGGAEAMPLGCGPGGGAGRPAGRRVAGRSRHAPCLEVLG